MTCIYCGEIYSPRELKELKQTGEDYYLGDDGFICPDCLDRISVQPAEDQLKKLLNTIEHANM